MADKVLTFVPRRLATGRASLFSYRYLAIDNPALFADCLDAAVVASGLRLVAATAEPANIRRRNMGRAHS